MTRKIRNFLFIFSMMLITTLMVIVANNSLTISFAGVENKEMFLYLNNTYYSVKADLSSFKKITSEAYDQAPLNHPDVFYYNRDERVKGINAVKVPYEEKGEDIFVKGVKIFTLQKDPVNAVIDVDYSVSAIYEMATPDQRLFYYIINDDGVTRPNSYGDTDDLVEVKNEKVIHHIQVYDDLEYLNSDTWQSVAKFSGAGVNFYRRHSMSGKYKELDLHEAVMNFAKKEGATYKPEVTDVKFIGKMDHSLILSLKCRDNKGKIIPKTNVYEVTRDNRIWNRKESVKTLSNDLFVYNYTVFSIEQQGQVIRRVSDLKSIYLSGNAKNLGEIKKTKNTLYAAKLPIYEYRGEEYICLEDIKLLGYAMKWDAKNRVGHWIKTGKKTGKIHVFNKTTVYDNDVFASINGEYVHIYNVEGYSLIKTQDAYDYIQKF